MHFAPAIVAVTEFKTRYAIMGDGEYLPKTVRALVVALSAWRSAFGQGVRNGDA